MEKYKFQNRSQKKSQSCVPLTFCQSRLYPPVKDLGFDLWPIFKESRQMLWYLYVNKSVDEGMM